MILLEHQTSQITYAMQETPNKKYLYSGKEKDKDKLKQIPLFNMQKRHSMKKFYKYRFPMKIADVKGA